MPKLFDSWPDKYEQWFHTPIGRLVRDYEKDLILEMLRPTSGERILDAGCGTGIFTRDLLAHGAWVAGLEISLPMVMTANAKLGGLGFRSVSGDMLDLPFPDDTFDKVVSITAIEFIEDAKRAIDEAFRVAKPAATIVVATLNSLSPWAERRSEAGKKGHTIFRHALFRSPEQVANLTSVDAAIQTAIHFQKDEDPLRAKKIEEDGKSKALLTGAFLAAKWIKPS